jgi:hypothetical protein
MTTIIIIACDPEAPATAARGAATQSRAPLTAPGTVTGHLAWAGVDPAAFMTQYADRIAAVHLKDVHLEMA